MLRKLFGFMVFAAFFGCGSQDGALPRVPTQNTEEQEYRDKVLALQGALKSLVESDFKTCSGVGESSDALIKRICQIAQASTNEARLEMQNVISQALKKAQAEIDAGANDIASLYTQINSINTSLSTINAIVSAGFFEAEVGSEMVAAGPLYEKASIKQDRTRVNMWVEGDSTAVALVSNPINAVNSSPTVTISKPTATITVTVATPGVVTYTGHGFVNGDPVTFSTSGSLPTGMVAGTVYYVRNKTLNTFELGTTPFVTVSVDTTGIQSGVHTGSLGVKAGDLVKIAGATSGRGFTIGDTSKEVRVTSVTISTVVVDLPRNATSGGTFGGSLATLTRVTGRATSSIWVLADGTDAAVRTTSLSTRACNFIVKVSASKGYVCYDSTNCSATFATIDAATTFPSVNGNVAFTGNIACK